jgi:hypothetical protein
VRIAVSVDDVGAEIEYDEPFAKDTAEMLRILGAEVINLYEASLTVEAKGAGE